MMSILSDVPAYETAIYETSQQAFAAREVAAGDSGEAFVIETADTAAGVIVRQRGGYRFFASNDRFQLLDGSVFKNPQAAQAAAELMQRAAARDLAERRRSHAAGFLPDVSWS
jgi:hypothetical protein